MADFPNPILEMLKQVAQRYVIQELKEFLQANADKVAGAAAAVTIGAARAKLAAKTNAMVNSSDAKTIVTGLFIEFMTGVGPADRTFGDGSVMAKHMKDAPGVKNAKAYFYKTRTKEYEGNKTRPGALAGRPLTEYSAGFGLTGLFKAGLDPVEQYIGNFKVEIFPNHAGTEMKIVCTNDTSIHSFLYHLPFVKNYDRSGGILPTPMGTIRQTIYWTEPIDNKEFDKLLPKK
jgi:hypothetical protein